MDDRDRLLIERTQAGLPLTRRPYADIAAQIGLSPEETQTRLQAMRDSGVIRRIAVVPNHYALGYASNGMSVWDVAHDVIHECGRTVGALPYVSHCYHRPRRLPAWRFNLFAMVHGRTRDEVVAKVEQIAGILGSRQRGHEVLFSTRILKKTGLRLKRRDPVTAS